MASPLRTAGEEVAAARLAEDLLPEAFSVIVTIENRDAKIIDQLRWRDWIQAILDNSPKLENTADEADSTVPHPLNAWFFNLMGDLHYSLCGLTRTSVGIHENLDTRRQMICANQVDFLLRSATQLRTDVRSTRLLVSTLSFELKAYAPLEGEELAVREGLLADMSRILDAHREEILLAATNEGDRREREDNILRIKSRAAELKQILRPSGVKY